MADSQGNINNPSARKRVLIGALDWGLGHAARCVPLIHRYRQEGWDVFPAAAGKGLLLFREEFPSLTVIELPAYDVQYSKTKYFFTGKLLWQSSKINDAIKAEQLMLKDLMSQYHFDLIISDNRFGLHHPEAESVFMTHQLRIQTGSRLSDWFAQRINYQYINRFDKCIVPDLAGENNLAGRLSHPEKMPEIPVEYIGPLSRLSTQKASVECDALFVCSGPEPVRTQFESLFIREAGKHPDLRFALLRGYAAHPIEAPHNVDVRNHASVAEMSLLFAKSKLIVSAAGYSTIMDLYATKRPAVLIPTPGQGEQEYLAKYHAGKRFRTSTLSSFRLWNFI